MIKKVSISIGCSVCGEINVITFTNDLVNEQISVIYLNQGEHKVKCKCGAETAIDIRKCDPFVTVFVVDEIDRMLSRSSNTSLTLEEQYDGIDFEGRKKCLER